MLSFIKIKLLSAKCDPNIHNGEGLTSLHVAASLGYSDIVQTLLDYSANKNDSDNTYHATPLFIAAYNGHLEAVQALLSIRPNTVQANTDTQVTIPMKVLGGTDDDGTMQMTALHIATEKNYLEIVQALLKAKINFDAQASNGRTALHIAAHNGNLEIVQALTAAGADPNIKDQDGNTPLHHAVAKGHLQIAKELLRAGANPNIDNTNHKTPLHFATQHGYFDIVQTLLITGANPSAQNKQGKTACDIAFEFSHQEIFEYLNKVPQLITALKTALDRNSLDTIKKLMLQGAPLVDEQKNYLLHDTIGTYIKVKPQEYDKKVRTLISAAGLVACGIRNQKGQTPLHIAAIQGNCWAAEFLLRKGAYPNIADYRGNTPLHYAASIQIRNKLLSYGANPALVNAKGKPPFLKHRDLWPEIFRQEQDPIGELSEQDYQIHDQSTLKPIL
jgi:ankyrin repeat protein